MVLHTRMLTISGSSVESEDKLSMSTLYTTSRVCPLNQFVQVLVMTGNTEQQSTRNTTAAREVMGVNQLSTKDGTVRQLAERN